MGLQRKILQGIDRDSSRDGCIEKLINRNEVLGCFGLFWAGGASEKKKLLTAISMHLFGVVFQLLEGKKKFNFSF